MTSHVSIKTKSCLLNATMTLCHELHNVHMTRRALPLTSLTHTSACARTHTHTNTRKTTRKQSNKHTQTMHRNTHTHTVIFTILDLHLSAYIGWKARNGRVVSWKQWGGRGGVRLERCTQTQRAKRCRALQVFSPEMYSEPCLIVQDHSHVVQM